MFRCHPLNVAITPINDPDKTPGGIIIPEKYKGRCDQGLIKYVGSRVPDWLQPGMYVIFSGYSGSLLNIEGEGTLIVTRHHTIAGIIPEVGNIIIPGLYHKDAEGNFFPATYESAANFLAAAFHETELHIELHKKYYVPKELDWAEEEDEVKT